MRKRIICVFLLLIIMVCSVPAAPTEVKAATYASEYRAAWLAYYDFQNWYDSTSSHTRTSFVNWFRKIVTDCKDKQINHLIVHVRPFGDALYKSQYFPTSACIAGKQGGSISFDPLSVMVSLCHQQGIKIEAWINPYRVAFGTSYSKLSSNNRAKKWHNNPSTARNVLTYDGQIYYNPSQPNVRSLIIKGVVEIVKNYNVDGIHLDDYFYPYFTSSNYRTAFDAKEYNASAEKKSGMAIESYRRKQVNILVKAIKKNIKAIKPKVTFGISPAGEISELKSKHAHYVTIDKWLNSTDYVDYICPQIYWGFKHSYAPYDRVLRQWMAIKRNPKVKMYIGLAVYNCNQKVSGGSATVAEWKRDDILAQMVQYGRKQKVNGFSLFDYSDLNRSGAKAAVKKMVVEFKK